MSPRANIRSLDSVRHVRPALIRFQDDACASISSLRQEVNRSLQWIDHDCPHYWQQQIRKGFDRVAEARTQLTRRQMMTIGDHRPDCIDEKKALAKAKRDLEIAQEKLRLCREWSVKMHRAADEYTRRLGQIEQAVNQRVPKMVALLDRIVTAIEAYTSSPAPTEDAVEVPAESEPEADPVVQVAPPEDPNVPTGDPSAAARTST
jgi:hypothetical protein